MKITRELMEHGFSDREIKIFNKEYPNGVDVSIESVTRMQELGINRSLLPYELLVFDSPAFCKYVQAYTRLCKEEWGDKWCEKEHDEAKYIAISVRALIEGLKEKEKK